MLFFFSVDKKEIFTIHGGKTLCLSMFDKTVIQISIVLVDQVYEHNELLLKAKTVINLVSILNFDRKLRATHISTCFSHKIVLFLKLLNSNLFCCRF